MKYNFFFDFSFFKMHLFFPALPIFFTALNLPFFDLAIYTVYPKDINELDAFVEKNTAIEYYYNDEMITINNERNA